MSKVDKMGWRSIVVSMLLIGGSVTLNSCGSARSDKTRSDAVAPAVQSSPMPSAAATTISQAETRSESKVADSEAKIVPISQKPQLVKTAELSLRLESIDKMMVQLRQVMRSKQGDIYNFQDDRARGSGDRRQATLTLKVPSTVLDATLAEISKLGRVESQGIKSDDVTQQLVDTDARLKNLRQQEDLTRKIMDRSGSVRDILAVSKELSSIREQIEQLDATAKNLRQQVAYSTINLKVEETQTAIVPSEAFGTQVQETWKNSTHAAGSLGTNLALGLLWLLPFAPFIGVAAGGMFYVIRRSRRATTVVEMPRWEEER